MTAKRGVQAGILKTEPLFPERTRDIIRRKKSGQKLQDIADHYGITPAGALHHIQRWSGWAEKNA